MPDKIITAIFVTLIVGAAIFAHINLGLRLEADRLEEQRLDELGCVGFMSYDPETMQFVFVSRK